MVSGLANNGVLGSDNNDNTIKRALNRVVGISEGGGVNTSVIPMVGMVALVGDGRRGAFVVSLAAPID
jgi:hypothetical protein